MCDIQPSLKHTNARDQHPGAWKEEPNKQSDSTMADKLLDTQGLACPLPILKTKKALREMAPQQTLEVLATDPGSALDFEAFCKATGHSLLTSENNDGIFRFVIQRTAQ